MALATASGVEDICRKLGNDRTRLMDIIIAVQRRYGCVTHDSMEVIARAVGTQRVEVESAVTFYSFLSVKPQGRVVIRLCNDLTDWMKGYDAVADAMAKELGVTMGDTTADGAITLAPTPCIGMSDQAPAALVNDVVVTHLTPGARPRDDPRPAAAPRSAATRDDGGRRQQRASARARDGAQQHPAARPRALPRLRVGHRADQRAGARARRGHQADQRRAPARPRRRGLPGRHQVGRGARDAGAAALDDLQRRRGRTRHVQGPGAAHRVSRARCSRA